MEFVDIHTHFVPPELVSTLETQRHRLGINVIETGDGKKFIELPNGFRTTLPLFDELTSLDLRLAQQERMGIGIQVLSGWNDLYAYQLDPRAGQEFCRLANDIQAAVAAGRPDKLRAMATVPLQSGARAADEIRYAAGSVGMRAVQIGTSIQGRNLDTTDLDPFWGACQELEILIVIHPSRVEMSGRLEKYFMSNFVGNPTETTIAAASMLYGGVFDRFPSLKVCLVHGGGFVPYQFGRLDQGYATNAGARSIAKHKPSHYLDHFWFDTLTYSVPALRYLVDLAGPEHVLYGTDVPFPIAERDMTERFDAVLEKTTDGDRSLIAGGNAKKLLAA